MARLKSYPTGADLKAIGEQGLLSILRKNFSRVKRPDILRGIGEDCAVIPMSRTRHLLVTTDTLVEGIHFRLDYTTPYLLGKKAMAVNLSDVASMGGAPTHAFLNLALPEELPVSFVRQLIQGINFWCRRYSVPIIGGDTVSCPYGVVLTITVLGEGHKGEIALRSGAREGDLIFVSGYLGDAAAGLALLAGKRKPDPAYRRLVRAQLDPIPQLELGRYLAGHKLASAMIDLSDGLATDLAHIAEESGVAAEIDYGNLPISVACCKLAKESGASARAWALFGGEDYGILFTVSPDNAEKIKKEVKSLTGAGPFCVGKIVKGRGVFLWEGGYKKDITHKGYDHFAKKQS
ncbi:MAG: thiamine-phosphate kinase [Thermodesulfobacteriota bacterium]